MNLNKQGIEKFRKANKELEKITKEKQELEEQMLELRRQIKNSERKLRAVNRSDEWKKRNHILIEYGALIEIAELIGENKALLLGYLLKFKKLSENEKQILKINGSIKFEVRKRRKEKIRKEMNENRKKELKGSGEDV
ncbi:conjugal transfer protein TraD [Bacteroides heparinolyticus]|uniref:conjugal transfer protein TraD n=1 Tax=Prevotella heparinolytica TaxID=28113 RepID=UPI0035A0D75D